MQFLMMCLLTCRDSKQAAIGTMDYIIDTISAVHSLTPLLGLLKLNGKLVTVGLPNKPLEVPIFQLALGEPSIVSKLVLCSFCMLFASNCPRRKEPDLGTSYKAFSRS